MEIIVQPPLLNHILRFLAVGEQPSFQAVGESISHAAASFGDLLSEWLHHSYPSASAKDVNNSAPDNQNSSSTPTPTPDPNNNGTPPPSDGADTPPNTCGNSFSPDTLVATYHGEVAIDSLKIGEHVLSYNEQTRKVELEAIDAVLVHLDPVTELLTVSGEVIRTTPQHPFYTTDHGWVKAGRPQFWRECAGG